MEVYYTDFFDEEETIVDREVGRKAKRRKRKGLWLLPILAVLLLLGYFFFALPIGWDIPLLRKTATEEKGWNLVLVNSEYYLPEDYEVELVELRGGQEVDRRIYPDLQEMFDDMRHDGVYPIVASGYRTARKQQSLLDEKIQEYENMGKSWWTARRDALECVSKPGTSEHQLGIAVDINQEAGLSTAQQIYDWLEQNAYRYGFIYRYPADKVAITGISNEPWHYRYVGREVAMEIHERGICLEEYLDAVNENIFFY